ncbi:Tryptophan 2,3-dioxygenase [Gracilaria domingensis]|nr:Tryptophan 2,3-dioxygenase [Gracilaria domingensis]
MSVPLVNSCPFVKVTPILEDADSPAIKQQHPSEPNAPRQRPTEPSNPLVQNGSSPVHLAHRRPSCPFSATEPANSNATSGLGVGEAGRGKLYYSDYLALDQLLTAQRPISSLKGNLCHDEMLFITIHQTYELWFKQLIFELDSVRFILAELDIGEKLISLALHRLTRIREILKLLNDQIKVLKTMTPQEFLEFRDYLFPASGFQSHQFRLLEIKFGVSPEQRLNARWILNLSADHQQILRNAQQEPSLFDYVERWLRNIPFREFRGYNFQKSYETAIQRMFEIEQQTILTKLEPGEREAVFAQLSSTYRTFESVFKREVHDELIKSRKRRMGFRATSASLMIMLYQDEPMFQLPARFLQMLIDVDEQLNQWRYAHSQMVHRMIGVKMGTGGSLGHSYLKRTIDSQKVFSDLANLSTLLIPRRLLPDLPRELRDQMRYFHTVEQYDRTMFEMGGGGDEIDWSFC